MSIIRGQYPLHRLTGIGLAMRSYLIRLSAAGAYVVVGDAAIAAVADVARADQIVFAQLDVRAIGMAVRPPPQCRGSGKRTYWLMTSTIAASSLSTLMCWALIRRNAGAVAMSEACRAV